MGYNLKISHVPENGPRTTIQNRQMYGHQGGIEVEEGDELGDWD